MVSEHKMQDKMSFSVRKIIKYDTILLH